MLTTTFRPLVASLEEAGTIQHAYNAELPGAAQVEISAYLRATRHYLLWRSASPFLDGAEYVLAQMAHASHYSPMITAGRIADSRATAGRRLMAAATGGEATPAGDVSPTTWPCLRWA